MAVGLEKPRQKSARCDEGGERNKITGRANEGQGSAHTGKRVERRSMVSPTLGLNGQGRGIDRHEGTAKECDSFRKPEDPKNNKKKIWSPRRPADFKKICSTPQQIKRILLRTAPRSVFSLCRFVRMSFFCRCFCYRFGSKTGPVMSGPSRPRAQKQRDIYPKKVEGKGMQRSENPRKCTSRPGREGDDDDQKRNKKMI